MFVTAFKEMLHRLPSHEAGYDAFRGYIDHCDNPAVEFFARVTNYALNKSQPIDSAPVHYDPRFLMTAIAISRFPLETLIAPEEPLRFTLLDKAMKFIEAVDNVLKATSNRSEDDASDDFLDVQTATEYLHALNAFHAAWTELTHRQCGFTAAL
jgi:hypothetical protein